MVEKSILFIGNGFDLKYGRKTSYKDFIESRYDLHKTILDFIKEEYENEELGLYVDGDIINFIEILKLVNKRVEKAEDTEILEYLINNIFVIWETNNQTLTYSKIFDFDIYLKFILLVKFYMRQYADYLYKNNYINEYVIGNWRLYNNEPIKKILEVGIAEINKDKTNTWIEYFQYLYYRVDDRIVESYKEFFQYGKWLDLENIIKYNFDSKYLNDDLAPTYNKHMKLKEIENTEEGKKVSFQEMKKELVTYLMFKSSSINLIDFDKKVLNNYTNKVSFNYTRIFNLGDQKNEEEYFHIHGNVNNDENIVFGFDESELFLNSGEKLSDEGVLYTKVDQIIELNDKRVNKDINHFNERYDRLGIYGLSMGVPDYSYYSNVILKNLDNIIIEIYYSDTEMCRNKQELRQSFYHLMKYIEMLAGKPLYNEMIISNRVKFIKQEYN